MTFIKEIKSIIFVDDDPASNYIHNLVLNRLDLSIDPKFFLSVKDALTYLSNNDDSGKPYPEIIFVDINMPVMDGWDFVREYKNTFFKPERKQSIIMLSSSIAPDDIKKASEYEIIFDFIEKPLSVALLANVLANLEVGGKDKRA